MGKGEEPVKLHFYKVKTKNLNTRLMKSLLYFSLGSALLLLLFSCGISKRATNDSFYNKYNELDVKSKKKLFSSRYYTFGPYETGKKEKGINKSIVSFKTQRDPFHISLSDGHNNTTSIQAVYTSLHDLKNKNLPYIFNTSGQGELFYAWVGGGSMNALKNWELIVKNPTYTELKNNDEVGVFQSVDEDFTVNVNNRFGSPDSYDNICYEFRLRGVPVAAVQVNGNNRVWIDKQLDQETSFALAGAITALLVK